MTHRHLLIPFLLTAFAAVAAPAPETGTITGTVVDEQTKRPVAGAVIQVDASDRNTLTDEAGRFAIRGLPIGTYRLSISRAGFAPQRVADLVVLAERDTPVAVRLLELPTVKEDIEVRDTYFSRPVEVTNSAYGLRFEEIRRAAGGWGDVNRVIQTMPGVATRDDGRNDIIARGGSPIENLTLVDGIEVPSLNHFASQGASGGPISMLNTELISQADFLAGGFPAQYGDRLSSVLDVSLREGNRERFEKEFELSGLYTGMLLEGPLGSKGSWIVSARRSYMEAAGIDPVPRFSNYQAKGVYDLNERNRLTVLAMGGTDGITFDGDEEDNDQPTYRVRDSGWRNVVGLKWQRFFGTNTVGTLTLSNSISKFGTDVWDRRENDQLIAHNGSRENESTLKYDVRWLTASGNTWQVGASVKRIGASFDLNQPIGLKNPFSIELERVNALTLLRPVTTHQEALYAQWTHPLRRNVDLTLGSRVDYFAFLRAARTSPRAGLTWRLSRRLELNASYGRYHQAPPLVFVNSDPANKGLKPMRADHFVTGLAYTPRPDLKFTVEAYYKRYGRYPVSTEYPFFTMANSGDYFDVTGLLMPLTSRGKGSSRGIEFYVQKKLTRKLYGQASYAYSMTRHYALDGVRRAGSFDLPHVFSLSGGYRFNQKWELSSRFTATSGRPDTPYLIEESTKQNRGIVDTSRINGIRNKAYNRLDLRLDRRFSVRWGTVVVFAEADNLYDRQNVRQYYWDEAKNRLSSADQLERIVFYGVNFKF